MSIETVAPGAITEQRDGGTIEVAFSGRFAFGIYRWATYRSRCRLACGESGCPPLTRTSP